MNTQIYCIRCGRQRRVKVEIREIETAEKTKVTRKGFRCLMCGTFYVAGKRGELPGNPKKLATDQLAQKLNVKVKERA